MKTHLLIKSAFYISCVLILLSNKGISQQQNFSCGPTVPNADKIDMNKYEIQRALEMQVIKNGLHLKSSTSTYIIPIVFHIIHEYGSENISDAQITDAIRILNEDYQKQNSDTSSVSSTFKTIIGNANIEFRLAKIDPKGNCTNGIERIYSHETVIGNDDSKINPWPRDKYLNVWVVKSMQNGVAGYAYYPSATTQGFSGYVDGIIILNNYIGSIGTSSIYNSRALTHEIGHYLGLPHTWGSTNDPGVACGDDGIADTPETKGWTQCVTNGLDFCNHGIEENIQNYMEYSYCSQMFTNDQVAGMRAVLNSPIALRNNLWQESNLISTGVENNSISQCVPIADFYIDKKQICKGGSVNLKDNSYNGTVDSWSWTIEGGTPSTSSSQNPNITYNQAGWHSITLTVSNQEGGNSKTIEKAIYVSDDYDRYSGLAVEDFESFNIESVKNQYITVRTGNENTETAEAFFNQEVINVANWELATDVGYSGSKSMRLDAFRANDLMVDEFVTPSFDLTLVSSPHLIFKYSAATSTNVITDITEVLKIYVSTNCGVNWQLRGTIDELDLITAGFEGGKFKPSSINQWKTHTISLPSSLSRDNVRFKFEYTSGEKSNDIYIDDIGIEGVLGIPDQKSINNLSIYPTPSSSINEVTIEITSGKTDVISLQIYNSMGEIIASKNKIEIEKGNNQLKLVDIGIIDIPVGTYLIKVNSSNNTLATQRLIII